MITLYNENDVQIRDIRIYEINDADMGESTITATVKFDQVMQFHPDWYVLYNGEKYRLGVTEPSGKRSVTQINIEYSLIFHSSREDLKRYTFMDFVEYGSDNPQPSQHTFSLQSCTLEQLVDRFNANLKYYLGSEWEMELSPDADPTIAANLSFDKASIWDVLLTIYQNYGVRWIIRNVDGVMTIFVGEDATELTTVFEYGNGNGLISVERTNPMERIVTRLRGKGGEKNLPANYFHAATSSFPIPDPDTNSILQNIFYSRLYPKCYRDYVKGYNAGTGTGTWAYNQGVADKVAGKPMNIVDFVKSNNEALWGVSYGAVEDNDNIYPTLQGATRDGVELDRVLAVSPIYVDSPEDNSDNDEFTQVSGAKGSFQGRDTRITYNGQDGGISNVTGINNAKSATAESDNFVLETAINTIRAKFLVTPTKYADFYASVGTETTEPISPTITTVADMSANHWEFIERIELIDTDTDEIVRSWSETNLDFFDVVADDIPAGTYKFRSFIKWYKDSGYTNDQLLYTINWELYGCEYASYENASGKLSFSETFDIWVGNIWNTSPNTGESAEDYAYRVWSPLVSKDDMTVMFSDGVLAGEDYEFRIVGATVDADNLEEIIKTAIHYDTSITGSHWRLTLEKSDAEFKASGKYLPNSVINAVAGNHFFFINIQMPYDPYIYDAERRLQDYLEDQLALHDIELPTFSVIPSSIFMANLSEVEDVKPGNKIRLRDTSLIGSSYTTFYIQSISKKYTENKINPDWSLVVSDQIVVNGNPISLIDGKVNALSTQINSNRQATRDAINAFAQFYLRKDGLADESYSPTHFKRPVILGEGIHDVDFREGDLNGQGFGIYRDANGRRVVEADILVGRTALRVNDLIINQAEYVSGHKIYSAASLTISKVEETSTIWRCYFDSKQGTERNLFVTGDLAFSQKFKGVETGGYTTYWAKVLAIGSDYIELSKTDIMPGSTGVPSVGDNVIQLGNPTDVNRQSAIIMSSYGSSSPSIRLYHGITGYTLSLKDIYGVEYDYEKGYPYFYNYGSMRLGAKNTADGGYIDYDHINKTLNIKAVVNFLPQSTGLENMESYQKLVQIAQGNIETWFYDDVTPAQTGVPTMLNYPVNSWEVSEYESHIGDIYYTDGGKGYRFKRNGNGWEWNIISDSELAQAMSQIQALQYLREATNNGTMIAGGLVLTSMIQLGYTTQGGDYIIMSGINGLGESTRGIAAWFGGPMVDKEVTPAPTNYAASLFRFDGTGYLAKGNITWDANGYGQVGGSGNNYAIKWDANGISIGNGVYIGSDTDKTLGSIFTLLNKFDSWFGFDETNKAIYIKKQTINGVETNISFYAYGAITAGGIGTSGGGGGGTVTGISLGGGTPYTPASGSTIINLPAYPTTLPASDVSTWAKKASLAASDVPTLAISKISGLQSALDGKQATISDLSTIRTQAGEGHTAYGYFTNDKLPYSSISGAPTSLPASDVYDWAKAATKPLYAFSEIESKPTTLSGYGITDAIVLSSASVERISTGDNLNDYKTAGTYISGSASISASLLNCPYTGTGFKLVVMYSVSANYLWQELYTGGGVNRVYRRKYNNDSWTVWQQYLNEGNTDLITSVGTIASGVWHGTAVTDAYIASSAAWNTAAERAAIFAELFEKDTTSVPGTTLIKAKFALYSNNAITAGGIGTSGGGGGGTVTGISLGGGTPYTPASGSTIINLPAYPTTLPASDVSAWAKAATKPSYAFNELTAHPTKLIDYGITDGWNLSNTNVPKLSEDEDLDDYKTAGTYICTSGAVASSLSHCPVTTVFKMVVYNVAGSIYFRQDLYQGLGNNRYYSRNYNNGTWTSWVMHYHSGNSNSTSVAWSASSLTLAGAITGATTGDFSGAVTTPRLNVADSGYITSTADTNVYINVGSVTMMAWMQNENAIRRGTATAAAAVTLGTASYPWASVYAKDFRIIGTSASGSDALLTADGSHNCYIKANDAIISVWDGVNNAFRRGTSNASVTLGTETYPWVSLYATSGIFGGTITASKLTIDNQGQVAHIELTKAKSANYIVFPAASDGTNASLRLATAATNAGTLMTIRSDGWLGLGTYQPSSKFDIYDAGTECTLTIRTGTTTGTPGIILQRGTATDGYLDWQIKNGGSLLFSSRGSAGTWTDRIKVSSTGNVSIAYDMADTPAERLMIDGNFVATGQVTAGTASDARLKDNVADISDAIRILKALRPVEFDWNGTAEAKCSMLHGHDVGLIAQEVENFIPSAVTPIFREYKRLDYTKVTPYLIAGWQVHESRIAELEAEVARLRYENELLRRMA